MSATYQIVNMAGQPTMPLSFPDLDSAKSVAQAVTSALGMELQVIKIEIVHKTTSLAGLRKPGLIT